MSVAFNTVQNMGEDLTMMLGYSGFNRFMHDELAPMIPPELDENGNEKMNIPLEVLSGGASYLFTSAMMEVIRREEKYIKYLFAGGEAVLAVLYARNKGWIESAKNRILNLKGFKAMQMKRSFDSQSDNTNSFVSQVYQQMQLILNGRDTSSVAETIGVGTAQQEHSINRERINLEFAKANTDAFSKSLMVKIASGTFTELDEAILKKVIGRSNFAETPINHQELNKIKEFMMIKDSNGNFIGLTKAFQSLINGLGFINK